jgi:hypothetical protein
MSTSAELALQISFGTFGVLSTIGTLAGLHHRDSLIFVLLRRLRTPRVHGTFAPYSHYILDCISYGPGRY